MGKTESDMMSRQVDEVESGSEEKEDKKLGTTSLLYATHRQAFIGVRWFG